VRRTPFGADDVGAAETGRVGVYCRTNAEGALLRFGKMAIPMLEKAASSKRFVRARRARRLLQKIRVK